MEGTFEEIQKDRPSNSQIETTDTGLVLLLCGLIFVLAISFMMFSGHVLDDGDTGWHLAAGRYILEHSQIPTTDPFSFTFTGHPWITHEWLSEVLMYASYSIAGWSGLVMLCGLAFASTLLILIVYSLRWLTPLQAAILVSITALCLLPSSLARPHLLAWPFLSLWTVALLQARAKDVAPSIWLAAMMLVWANFHGSYAIGLFLVGVFALESLVEAKRDRRWHVVKSWGLFGITCLVASVTTPAGPAGLYYPIMVSTMDILPHIGEWKPPNFSAFNSMSVGLYTLVFFTLFKPVRLPLIRLLLLIFLMHQALTHLRHIALFGIVGSLLLAEPLAQGYRQQASNTVSDVISMFKRQWREYLPGLALLGVVIAGIMVARIAIPLQRPNGPGWPNAALAALPQELRDQPVFNEYSFGGALIQEGIPAFIDGRADMYGNRFVDDYMDISAHVNVEKWRAADAKWQFQWAILRPEQKIAGWIDRQPEWEKIYSDKWAVVYVRK